VMNHTKIFKGIMDHNKLVEYLHKESMELGDCPIEEGWGKVRRGKQVWGKDISGGE
jgi:hypothetical protein